MGSFELSSSLEAQLYEGWVGGIVVPHPHVLLKSNSHCFFFENLKFPSNVPCINFVSNITNLDLQFFGTLCDVYGYLDFSSRPTVAVLLCLRVGGLTTPRAIERALRCCARHKKHLLVAGVLPGCSELPPAPSLDARLRARGVPEGVAHVSSRELRRCYARSEVWRSTCP